MSDDIVTRLRQLALAMSEARFPALEATAIQAADEIERLRNGGCARDQRTTQYCAEAGRLQQERDGYLVGNQQVLLALSVANETARRYRRERDEARRLYINEMCLRDYGDTSDRIREAKARGWECFDSDGWSDPGDECQREAL
jgi:hypothetical protein